MDVREHADAHHHALGQLFDRLGEEAWRVRGPAPRGRARRCSPPSSRSRRPLAPTPPPLDAAGDAHLRRRSTRSRDALDRFGPDVDRVATSSRCARAPTTCSPRSCSPARPAWSTCTPAWPGSASCRCSRPSTSSARPTSSSTSCSPTRPTAARRAARRRPGGHARLLGLQQGRPASPRPSGRSTAPSAGCATSPTATACGCGSSTAAAARSAAAAARRTTRSSPSRGARSTARSR